MSLTIFARRTKLQYIYGIVLDSQPHGSPHACEVSTPSRQENCVFATDLVSLNRGFCLHFVLLHEDLGSGNVGERPRSSVMWNTYHLSAFVEWAMTSNLTLRDLRVRCNSSCASYENARLWLRFDLDATTPRATTPLLPTLTTTISFR
jgi:hypothetical protein